MLINNKLLATCTCTCVINNMGVNKHKLKNYFLLRLLRLLVGESIIASSMFALVTLLPSTFYKASLLMLLSYYFYQEYNTLLLLVVTQSFTIPHACASGDAICLSLSA